MQRRALVALLAACAFNVAFASAQEAEVETPAQLYGKLFEEVQLNRVFPDGKTFVDAVPKEPPATIVQRYEEERGKSGFDLSAFVAAHFTLPDAPSDAYRSDASGDVCSHIDALWEVLQRKPDVTEQHSSLLPLPAPYVVPGGRFREIYYWDSYFTMLGLEESGRHDLARHMVDNFASLIERFGHIPNGNRTYYVSRSQPPFFGLMVDLVAAHSADRTAVHTTFLPALAKEYAFWMEGADTLAPGEAHRRVVRLPDGTLLNRYWDDRDRPRDESYREDVETARGSNRPQPEVYRHLRAAAESGWDFSSRWLEDGNRLPTIRTTDVVPVDLNSLLYRLETVLAEAYEADRKPEKAAEIRARAELRKAAVQRHLWDDEKAIFADYLWREDRRIDVLTAAALYPLFTGIATPEQAGEVAKAVRADLLKPGGLVTTTVATGEQWDAPNGWAPLQWIAIKGLADYGETDLARTIAERFANKAVAAWRATGKLMEKYNVVDEQLVTGGGEYPTQDGFGWTNGVLRKILVLYPDAVKERDAVAGCASRAANDNRPPARQPATAQ